MNFPSLVFFGSLIALWAPALWHLSALWLAFPQYRYGFVVPLAAVYLAIRKWHGLSAHGPDATIEPGAVGASERGTVERAEKGRVAGLVSVMLVAEAGLLLLVRVIHEANPLWRLTSWALVLLVVGLTLGAIYMGGGRRWLKAYTFPALFMLVAVPWPSPLELPLIQGLAGLNTGVSVEILNALGVAAVRHANVVEIAAGMVGVDDACSGVQSLQTTLALALFMGEYFRLKAWERSVCVGIGLVLAFVFNVVRTVLLTLVAAKVGISAISQWHDVTGVAIGVACFACVALLGLWFRPQELKRRWAELIDGELPEERALRMSRPDAPNVPPLSTLPRSSPGYPEFNFRAFQPFAVALVCWVLLMEVATEVWYRAREASIPPAVPWVIEWPTSYPAFSQEPMGKKVMQAMQCDSATRAFWGGGETGEVWLVNYLRWEPRHTSAHLARLHSPESCLPMAGWKLTPLPSLRRIGPLEPPLPFRAYRIDGYGGRPGFVFYCRSGDRRNDESQEDDSIFGWPNRLQAVWRGRTEQGMTVLEVVVWGPADDRRAQELVETALRKIIKKSG